MFQGTRLWLVPLFCVVALARSDTGSILTQPSIVAARPAVVRFVLDKARSKFMVHAHRGGLAWFKGHDHYIAVKDFTGEASLTLDALKPASVVMTVDAGSLEETGADFTDAQKAIIKKELNEIVLETAKYPTITFHSTDVQGGLNGGLFEITIGGDITMHGVTRHITIPAKVIASGVMLNANGEFTLNRSDFGVNATSAFHGWVRVQDKLTFTFSINALPA